MATAAPQPPALDAQALARIAIMSPALLTDDDRGQLASWRKRTSDPHVLAAIDALLAA